MFSESWYPLGRKPKKRACRSPNNKTDGLCGKRQSGPKLTQRAPKPRTITPKLRNGTNNLAQTISVRLNGPISQWGAHKSSPRKHGNLYDLQGTPHNLHGFPYNLQKGIHANSRGIHAIRNRFAATCKEVNTAKTYIMLFARSRTMLRDVAQMLRVFRGAPWSQ